MKMNVLLLLIDSHKHNTEREKQKDTESIIYYFLKVNFKTKKNNFKVFKVRTMGISIRR